MSETIEARPLAVRESSAIATWTPSFAVAVDEAIERKREKRRFFEGVMDVDLHYGVIPGTGTKPTLLKPGAEMLLANMGLHAEFSDAEAPIVDVTGDDHGGEAYIRYRRSCRIYRQTGPKEDDRMVVGKAEGVCSSWEAKYRWRKTERLCPSCGKPAIIAGKPEYGGGWLCFKKRDGCGNKFQTYDQRITSQVVGRVPNPDVVELENTILKMADKRALIAATLIATGCSDIFTQDLEDQVQDAEYVEETPPPPERVPNSELIALHAKADSPEGTLGKWLVANFSGYAGGHLSIEQSIAAARLLKEIASAGKTRATQVLEKLVPRETGDESASDVMSEEQRGLYFRLCDELGYDDTRRHGINELITGKKSSVGFTKDDVSKIIDELNRRLDLQNASSEDQQ